MFASVNKSTSPSFSTVNQPKINDKNQASATPLINNLINENEQPESLRYLDEYLKSRNPDQNSSKKLEDGTPLSEVRPVVENFFKELVKNNDFCCQVKSNENILSSIMAEHFKNQFETGSSEGILNFDDRKRVVNQIFGIPSKIIDDMLGEKVKIPSENGSNKYVFQNGNKMEKYGYLDKKENAHNIPYYYGNIKFVFKKNSLMGRTTMTFGDSLLNVYSTAASRVANPKIESIPGVICNDYERLEILYNLIEQNIIKPTDGAMNIIETYNNYAFQLDHNATEMYLELQFHGDLTKNDVDECIIPPTESKAIESIFNNNNILVKKYNDPKFLQLLNYSKCFKSDYTDVNLSVDDDGVVVL